MTIELGNRLAELRKQHGLSQEELADQLGVSRQAVSKWERGEASPDTDNLIELARIYGISLDELLGLSKKEKEDKDDDNINVHISSDEANVHFSGKGSIRDEDGNEVNFGSDGIHIKDEDGSEVHVSTKGVQIKDANGEHKHVNVIVKDKKQRINALVSLITTFGVVIAYILLGAIGGLWAQAWTLFLLIPIVPTLCEAIIYKNANIFAYPIFLAFIYLTLCAWVLPSFDLTMWHPLWVMFLTIPVYYGVCNFIKPKTSVKVIKPEVEIDGEDLD